MPLAIRTKPEVSSLPLVGNSIHIRVERVLFGIRVYHRFSLQGKAVVKIQRLLRFSVENANGFLVNP